MPKKSYYQQVSEEYQRRRKNAQARCDERKLEVYSVVPAVRDIDMKLAATGVKILAAAKSGGNIEGAVGKIKSENSELRNKRAELLKESGFPADFTDMVYTCPKCKDSGFVGIDMCECMKHAIAEARLADSEIGTLAKRQSFENFSLEYYESGRDREIAEKNAEILRDFAESFTPSSGKSFILVGDTGLGKTHLSTATGAAVICRGYDVVYKSVANMIDDFNREQFRGADPEDNRKYFDCDLLIIDDLGSEMTTSFTVSALYNVINTRINSAKSTVISTNLTQTQIRERYSDRIASRLFGEYYPLFFKGVDIRRQKISRSK